MKEDAYDQTMLIASLKELNKSTSLNFVPQIKSHLSDGVNSKVD